MVIRTQRRGTRRGVATVELAFVLPTFIVLTFGAIEICQRLHIKQSAVIAAYETSREATRPNCTTEQAHARCQALLDQQNVRGAVATIQYVPLDAPANGEPVDGLDGIATRDEIIVQITVPWSPNVVSRYVVGDQGSFQVNAHMLRE